MADEIDGVRLQLELLQDGVERLFFRVEAGIGLRVLVIVFLDELQEFLAPSLLKQPHQVRAERLLVVGGHLLNLGAALREQAAFLHLVHIGPVDGCSKVKHSSKIKN